MMGLIRKWASRCRAHISAASPRARALAGGLCLVCLAGAAWLVVELAPAQPVYKPLTDGPMDATDLALATSLAEGAGIAYRVENSRLLVAAEHMDRLAEMLDREGLPIRDGGSRAMTYEQPVSNDNFWITEAERDKRRQAANMAKLGSLISGWPHVRRATVFFEPGSGSRLGRSAVKPTAAVHITLAQGARVDSGLVAAIADLVSSVVGMDPAHVCIVDSTGRSYRPGDGALAAAEASAERLRRSEGYYTGRVRAAVSHIDNAVVSVSVEGDDGVGRCVGASVSVPRSYLAAAYMAVDGQSTKPNDAQLDAFAADRLARVQRSVTRAVGLAPNGNAESAEAVKVDWYYDAAPAMAAVAPAPAHESGQGPDGETFTAAGCWALASLGLLCGAGAYGRARMLRRIAQQSPGGQSDEPGETQAAPELGDPLARLREAGSDQLRSMLAVEHPQTQALILAQVSPEAAAEVLAGWSPERQVDVSRRIAALGHVEPAVVGEALRGLIEQWTNPPGQASGPNGDQAQAVAGAHDGGVGKMARILNHAGGATEKAVLDGLTGVAPALAESIRKRMFVFDDVALLPRTVLRSARESLASDELAIALRTASAAVTEKMLSALPRGAAGKVREEMDRIGPVRLSDVEAAQERVVAAVRRLEDGLYTSAPARKGSEVLA